MENQAERVEYEDAKAFEQYLGFLDGFADELLPLRNEAVQGRADSGVERRWREDEDNFNGGDDTLNAPVPMMDYATGTAPAQVNGNEQPRSKVIVNIIRSQTETAESRFNDVANPTDKANWGLKPTPVPDLSEALEDDSEATPENVAGLPAPVVDPGTQQTAKIKDIAHANIKEAKRKMALMEAEISDQHVECSYNAECRKAVKEAAKLGTAIMKGPEVVKRIANVWKKQTDGTGSVYVMQRIEKKEPASKWVSCWNFYPDPNCGGNIKKAAYTWERGEILPRELRKLRGMEEQGYITENIERVLKEAPIRTYIADDNKKSRVANNTAKMGMPYETWEYNGDIDTEMLSALGCDCPRDKDDNIIHGAISACCLFVNDRIVKADLHPLDSGDLIYDVWPWTEVAGSVFGIGIPRMLMWLQRIITAAWRAMMDNAGDSAGVNLVIGKGLSPADGKWVVTGKKIWMYDDDDVDADVRRAFQQFQVANNQPMLENIIQLALQFVERETGIPLIFHGEQQKIPETLGATNIMVDSHNVGVRGRVKRWDDDITSHHLRRYYDWNMQYNENDDIKGDYQVDPRGVSVLYERDQEAKEISEILQLKQDPDFRILTDWEKVARQFYQLRHLDVMKSDDEIARAKEEEKNRKPQLDPTVEAAQIRAQADMEKAKMTQDADMQRLQFEAQEAEKQRQHDQWMAQVNFSIKQMEFSEKTGIELDKIKKDLAINAAKLNLQERLSADGSGPQVAEPVAEPEGRAPEGQAFER